MATQVAVPELTPELTISDVEPRVWEMPDDELFGININASSFDSCGSCGYCGGGGFDRYE
jgi:hypothetical protein